VDYSTSDIVCAATLLLFNAQLKDVVLQPGTRRGTFKLTNVNQEDVDDFDKAQLLVEPIRFHSNIRFLSSMISKLVAKQG
jgi:hypothetical protein